MSYHLSVLGYGYSRELEAERPLVEELLKLDARFTSFEFGSFLQELAGMKYKEVDGGFYSWMIYREGAPVQKGVSLFRPRDGERIYVVYQFFPSASKMERRLVPVEYMKPPGGPAPPDYEFVPPEEYALPELVEYRELGEVEEWMPEFSEQVEERPVVEYSKPRFTEPQPEVETYQLVHPEPSPPEERIPLFESDSELERFLMELLSVARLSFLLPAPVEEQVPLPLIRV